MLVKFSFLGAFNCQGACNGNFAALVINVIHVVKMIYRLEHSFTKHCRFWKSVINFIQFIMCHNDATKHPYMRRSSCLLHIQEGNVSNMIGAGGIGGQKLSQKTIALVLFLISDSEEKKPKREIRRNMY